MTTQTYRLFLSSPGDVAVERRRVAAVVSRLNGECAGRARIDVIRWETESYQAHATFQAQIPQAVECDLVLTIFKWRLGTELPPHFPERLPTGEPYPSGTAYELLTSIEQRRAGAESPDVFVYRYTGSSPRPELDDPNRERIEGEWARLNAFFERWFVTAEGHFLAAFQTYASEDDLEAQVDALLRKWLADKVAAGRILVWPDAIKGSPFPGLEAYGRRHATVFFGRDRDTGRAVELWGEAADKGSPFLLVVGASGSGKSSLARAGLVPRLTIPGVVEAVDLWRAAVFRPGDSPDGPIAALAAALLASERDLPLSEEGRGPALPELAEGDEPDAAALAALLASDPDAGAAAVLGALDRIGAAARASERRQRPVRVDLVLLVDQLDELFAPSLPVEARDAFVAALAALVASGRVWVVATLRADLYAAMLEHPGLKALKQGGASYDLAPPGPAELAEIVRRPAEAADLAFGRDPATGEGVDERLLREAERPDMLPLVQLALARLYEGRQQDGDKAVLPFEVYAGLGGLTGIIDEVGERAIAGLDPAALRALPRLTRELAQLETEGPLAGTLTVTPAPLATADEPRQRLVERLVAARLLTLSDAGSGSMIRLAHQRILTDWARTREIVAGSADFYRVRAEIERRRRRWEANRRSDLLLPSGLPLAEAENIVGRFGDEISPETRAYVRASRIRAGRAQMITAAAAVIFAVVAAGALWQWSVAREQTRLAERNFGVARDAVKGVVFNIVQGLLDVSGMRIDALRTILTTVQAASDQLVATAPDDPELLRSRAAMFDNFGKAYLAVGDVPSARTAAEKSVEILRRLLVLRPDDPRVEGDVSVPMLTLGDAAMMAGDLAGARRIFADALGLARQGAARAPDDPKARMRIVPPLSKLGDALYELGEVKAAREAYEESLSRVRREVAAQPDDAGLRRDLALALAQLAYVHRENGDFDEARPLYGEAAEISRKLADELPANSLMQSAYSVALTNLGELDVKAGRNEEAMARFKEAVEMARLSTRRDPENADRQRALAITLEKLGSGAFALKDWPGALAAYSESLSIFRELVARNPFDLRNQNSVGIGLQMVAAVKRETGDRAGAEAASEERVAIARRLAGQQPGSAEVRRNLAIALRDLADLRATAGDKDGAVALYREAAGVAKSLSEIDPGSVRPLALLAELLEGSAALQYETGQSEGMLATYDELVPALRRLIELRPAETYWRNRLAAILMRSGVQRALSGSPGQGIEAIDASLELLRGLAREGGAAERRNLALGLSFKARVGATLGMKAAAVTAYQEAIELRRRLLSEGDEASRVELADLLGGLAELAEDPKPLLAEAASVLAEMPDAKQTDRSRALQASLAKRLGALP